MLSELKEDQWTMAANSPGGLTTNAGAVTSPEHSRNFLVFFEVSPGCLAAVSEPRETDMEGLPRRDL
jgi:hypothetical protein